MTPPSARRTLLEGLAFQDATVHPSGVLVQLRAVRPSAVPAGAGGAGGEAAELRTVQGGSKDDMVSTSVLLGISHA